ncbi:HIT family protein [Acetobacter vaccinii]|uniref:HIT domain-containing protein n=1 Tax=Acetobacter vaccinii TaxID=2592655 RepID=A0A5C1YQD4_9PROT|nr:hypothetical protein [Acetobacter vaccinii]QEO17450.1 hypothetical protein FLP30_06720 [Acetobacter vaccinii]
MPTENIIAHRVELARKGRFAQVIGKMPSGWLVVADTQPVPGYCILLADPVVSSLNALEGEARQRYLADVVAVGDALLAVTQAERINYETWCNLAPSLHTHIVPRYADEDAARRVQPLCVGYDIAAARPFDPQADAAFMQSMRAALGIAPAEGEHQA